MDSPTKIASFNEVAHAEALVERLGKEGIEADVHDESDQQKWQLWNLKPRAHLLVRVGVNDEARARALLQVWAAEPGNVPGAVRCPECGSFSIEYPQFSRKTLLGALPSALAAAGVIAGKRVTAYEHCRWEIEASGATYLTADQAVRDGRIVTGQTWQSHPEFYRHVFACLDERRTPIA